MLQSCRECGADAVRACASPEDEGVGPTEAQNQRLGKLDALETHERNQLLQEPSNRGGSNHLLI